MLFRILASVRPNRRYTFARNLFSLYTAHSVTCNSRQRDDVNSLANGTWASPFAIKSAKIFFYSFPVERICNEMSKFYLTASFHRYIVQLNKFTKRIYIIDAKKRERIFLKISLFLMYMHKIFISDTQSCV